MAQITFKGNPANTIGSLPAPGSKAPGFALVKSDLSTVTLGEFTGRKVILNIFPSIDTSVCAVSVRRFNIEAAGLEDTSVLCVSRDLPFAQSRFCAAEGISNVTTLSEFRDSKFSDAYGVRIGDGPLAGLLARAVVVIDKQGRVAYTEQVPEITSEPDYAKALAAVKSLS
ncbi:MAG TPA: thiol peroxidase [Acidobacteriota bacterium]|nr:thiol peroxidase [Acidobacteriota bacterium]